MSEPSSAWRRAARPPGAARLSAVAVAVLAALTLAPAALAHARPLGSTPANGAVLAAAPRQVIVRFDDVVIVAPGGAAIRNGGASVLAGPERATGRTVVLPLKHGLTDGDYTVRWRVLSDDGHLLEGLVAFAVGGGRAPPTPQLALLGSGLRWGFVLARWLFLLGTLFAFGAVAFRALVLRGGRPELAGPYLVSLSAAFAVALAGAGLSLVAVPDALATRFGKAAVAGVVIAAIGAALAEAARSTRRLQLAAAPAAIALVAAATAGGHALDPVRLRPLGVAVDLVHIGAAGLWIGGLVQLAIVLRLLGHDERAQVLRRFALLAAAGVALVAATGIGRAVFGLGSVHQAWAMGYGRLLLVKTGLLMAALAAGFLTRRRLDGRSGQGLGAKPGLGGVRVTFGVELLLVAGIVVAVAILGDLRPGRATAVPLPPAATTRRLPPLPASDAVVLAREEGEFAFAVAIRAAGATKLELTASVIGQDQLGADGLSVGLGADGPPQPTARCGSGCYSIVVAAPAQLRRVTVSFGGRSRSPFLLPSWPPRPAAALVERAATAFAALRTIVYEEHLASSPRLRQASHQLVVAPDRFAYEIDGGGRGVVIGQRRWDRLPGSTGWTAQATQQLRLPRVGWGDAPTNAHSIGRTTLDGHSVLIVTLLDPSVPAWFTVWIDKRRLLPLRLDMTAPAHFMVERYGPFNGPVTIIPPVSG